MVYKDKEKQAKARRAHYLKNKDEWHRRSNERRKRAREYVWGLKEKGQCSQCGFSHPAALQFHHIKGKDYGIGELIAGGWSPKRLAEELEKCILLCANCHFILHYNERVASGQLSDIPDEDAG